VSGSARVVAVLGYSGRRAAELHPICARRLAHAQRLAGGIRAVILSGLPEAELMRASWLGPDVELICDPDARSTADNVRNVASAAKALGARELVVVTSRWHRVRVRLLLWAALRRDHVRVYVEGVDGPSGPLVLLRELVCLAIIPIQLVLLARRGEPADAGAMVPPT
jgi:uncharacterized SAM-binding protein YcdF (DUF218 family)